MSVDLVFHCENCKLDWHDDAYCEACGASLMPTLRRREAPADPPPDWWSDLFAGPEHENGKERP